MIKRLFNKYRELIMYIFFGGTTTLVNWVVYVLMQKLAPGTGMNVWNAVAWVCAVAYAFVTNKLFVFESKAWTAKTVLYEAVTFVGSRALTGLLEIFCPKWLFDLGVNQSFLGIEGFWAKLLVSVIVIILNYVLSKLIVFRKKKKGA